MGSPQGALLEVEGTVQSPGGALISGYNRPAARQRFLDLLGQRARNIHTPFIRLETAENRVQTPARREKSE